MEPKKYTQFGIFSMIGIGSAIVLCSVIMIIAGLNNIAPIEIMGVVILPLVFFLLTFYKLTITIDDTYIQFSLGIGLIAKKYLISDIQNCKSVSNNPMYGVGIRKIPKGWLYNVTGLKAIEIRFKNSKSIVRIGTNRPDEIADIVSKMIKIDHSGSDIDYKDKTGFLLTSIIIAFTILFVIILFLIGNSEPGITLSKSGIKIKGIYGLTINYSDIQQLDTLSMFPRIQMRTNGYAFGKTLKGNFRLQNQENAKLFITKRMPPYIHIRTEKLNVYLNFKKPKKTVALYKTLTVNQE
jgi:multisubunit Na+/H+ antiporter MnhB subunit